MDRRIGIVVAAGLIVTCTAEPTSTSVSTGAGGMDAGADAEQPLPDPDAGGLCVPNGGITQMCDPDAGLQCPPICCDVNGCICFACRLQSDGVRRCVANTTDAGACP